VSLFAWLVHAPAAWPNAAFIAKADSDAVVVDVGLFSRLLSALPPRSVWGRMERCEFDRVRMTAHRFYSTRASSNDGYDGDLSFALPKGYLLALSTSVARELQNKIRS
jgi:hypothetical protein